MVSVLITGGGGNSDIWVLRTILEGILFKVHKNLWLKK